MLYKPNHESQIEAQINYQVDNVDNFELINPIKIEIEPPEFTQVNQNYQNQNGQKQNHYGSTMFELINPIKIGIEPPEFTEQSLIDKNKRSSYNERSSLADPEEPSVKFKPIEPIDLIEPIVIDVNPPVFGKLAELLKADDTADNTDNTDNTDNIGNDNRSGKTGFINLRKIFKQEPDRSEKTKKKKNLLSVISDILFYSAIITILFSILTSGPNNGAPKTIMGYSYFTVLTSSMQNEIPRGSFILVNDRIDPQELKVGDNITYMRDSTTSITHKIIDIYENYDDSGERGFQTKGVNNADPDKDIVFAVNVVGKVIFHIPKVGAVIDSLKANIYIVFIVFGLFIGLSFLIRLLLLKPKEKIINTIKI